MKSTMLRASVALLLAVAATAFTENARAMTSEGVTVPDVNFSEGTGNRTVDVTIGAGSPVVGSADQLAFSVDETVVVGVTAVGVGGSCSDWSCEPGSSGWRAGTIQVTVTTAHASPCHGSGVLYDCFHAPIVLHINGGGSDVDVDGSVLIVAPAEPTKPPTTARPTTARPTMEPSRSTGTTVTGQATDQQADHPAASEPAAASSQSASTAVAVPSASMTTNASASGEATTASSSPVLVDAADTSSASSSRWMYGGVGILLILLAAAFAVWRRTSRKQH